MQQVILGLLMLRGPSTLYALQKQFTQSVSLFYSASFGSIQRALRQLEQRGLVVAEDAGAAPRGRKPYAVTPAGRSEWRRWMLSPLTGSDLETVALARTFFLGLLPHDERCEVLAAIRRRVDEDLADLLRLAAQLDAQATSGEQDEAYRFQRATLDYGIRSHEHARAWFSKLARELD